MAPAVTLYDSRHPFDAYDMGYDGPCDPTEDGEGLIVTRRGDVIEIVTHEGQIAITKRDLLVIAQLLDFGRVDQAEAA